MAQRMNFPGRFGTLASAVLLAAVVTACMPIDTPTAPDQTTVSTKAVFQTSFAARFEFSNAVGAGSALSSDGITGVYQDAVCGVQAVVFYIDPNYMDANIKLDNRRASDRTCVTFGAAAYPRKFTIQYPDNNLVQANTGGINVFDLGNTEIGVPTQRMMNIRIAGTDARCTSLRFGSVTGSSLVTVTRTTATSWNVMLTGGTGACLPASGPTTFIDGFTFAFSVTLN